MKMYHNHARNAACMLKNDSYLRSPLHLLLNILLTHLLLLTLTVISYFQSIRYKKKKYPDILIEYTDAKEMKRGLIIDECARWEGGARLGFHVNA